MFRLGRSEEGTLGRRRYLSPPVATAQQYTAIQYTCNTLRYLASASSLALVSVASSTALSRSSCATRSASASAASSCICRARISASSSAVIRSGSCRCVGVGIGVGVGVVLVQRGVRKEGRHVAGGRAAVSRRHLVTHRPAEVLGTAARGAHYPVNRLLDAPPERLALHGSAGAVRLVHPPPFF